MSQDVTEPSSSTEPQLSAIEQIVAALAIEIGILQGVGAEGSAAALIEITNMVNRLCFSDCVNHFGRNPTKEETALIEAAKREVRVGREHRDRRHDDLLWLWRRWGLHHGLALGVQQ